MKLVLLYGPPAVGKATVAAKLATLTGFKQLQNQFAHEIIPDLFDQGSEAYTRTFQGILRPSPEEAMHDNRKGIIMTYVYSRSRATTLLKYGDLVEQHGGSAYLVQLTCAYTTLERRVTSVARADTGKIATIPQLYNALTYLEDAFSAIPGRASLCIDTDRLDPFAAAMQIIEHYRLPFIKSMIGSIRATDP